MAGSISLAGAQQFDVFGNLLGGGKVYWFQAGTTSTPQNAFFDPDLTLPISNPYTLQADARIPFHYLADGQIKVRIVDVNGVTRFEQDNILVIGPSSGGGGGGGVDPTTVLQTGAIVSHYGTGTRPGFVRLNGRTIGSATSGATEYANPDAQALFEFLWQNDSALAVSTGRGASSSADWAANKTIALPDGRGRVLAALDDMGSTAAGRLTASYFGASGTTLGAVGGNEKITLVRSDLPNTNVPVTITDPGHTHTVSPQAYVSASGFSASAGSGLNLATQTAQSSLTGITAAFNLNGGAPQTLPVTVQPTLLITNYIKL